MEKISGNVVNIGERLTGEQRAAIALRMLEALINRKLLTKKSNVIR